MPDNLLIPSVDLRIGSLEEYNRRKKLKAGQPRQKEKKPPCITISREFGCEAYPVAEHLRELMIRKTGEEWLLMDKALLEEVARRHNISEEVLRELGEKNRILNEVFATFSARWKSERDHFRLLCSHILSLGEQGNVIIVGRGSAIVTRHLENCFHFRLFASQAFKAASISRRLNMSPEDAETFVEKRQKHRDHFTSDFLGYDAKDVNLYHMLFNNDKIVPEKIAMTIADYVTSE
ncbi:MAG: cytidylate kinase-like family protein [Desulfuromonadales bacterium]|nr:MAG: cytidylate kinase-like family protein [Desulfuromonadales bacterium]